jgi:hypothetical protein
MKLTVTPASIVKLELFVTLILSAILQGGTGFSPNPINKATRNGSLAKTSANEK